MLTKGLALKKRLRMGEVTIGAWLTFTDPAVAEIMAGSGFDWLLIDGEHAPFTLDSLTNVLLAFEGSDTVAIVRVPWNDRANIKQVLDLGAGGVLVPYVCTAEEARNAVAACKYPPVGFRGFGPRRAAAYGRQIADYIERANEAVFAAIQIEHIDAVHQIDEIVAVPGLDAVLLGPMDLSASMGLLGQLDHPQVVQAMERVIATARGANLPAGIPLPSTATADEIATWIARGANFVVAGLDQGYLVQAMAQSLAGLRRRLGAVEEAGR